MSFSFRSLFQQGAGSQEPVHDARQHMTRPHSGVAGTMPPNQSPMQASPASMQFPVGNSPFQAGGSPLFKTAGNEAVAAPPINSAEGMSPFSIAGATPTNAPLTVGDVIGQLPPEVARMGALPAEQPLALPPALLENALRSGQAALPIFELYRVCPALFQTPVSPQDPRMVALPAAKLPALIAQARGGQGTDSRETPGQQSPSPVQASPFGLGASLPTASPFQAVPQSPFSVSDPISNNGQSVPASPFTATKNADVPQAEMPAPTQSGGSPFSMKPAASGGSPFSMAQPQVPSGQSDATAVTRAPFSTESSFGAPMSASPQPVAPFQAAVPGAGSPQPSPFGSAAFAATVPEKAPSASISTLFNPPAQSNMLASAAATTPAPSTPFGSPFAAAMQKEGGANSPQAPQNSPSTSASAPGMPASGVAKFGFAAVLSGSSADQLGFNPAVVPAWITTGVPAGVLNEQISSGSVFVELGMLIDGLSDVGFRNTLSAAKRDLRVKLPQNEVFHALTNLSGAAAAQQSPSAAGQGLAVPQQAASPGGQFVIQPGGGSGQVERMSAPAATPEGPKPGSANHLVSAFTQPAPAKVESSPPAAAFGAPNPFVPTQETAPAPFNPFAAASAQPVSQVPAASAPPSQPPQPLFPMAPAEAPAAGPLQPLAGAFKPFGAASSSIFASQPPAQPVSPSKPFDPFASSSSPSGSLGAKSGPESGFSSAQLLGQPLNPTSAPPPSIFSPLPTSEPKKAPESSPQTSSFAPALEAVPFPSPPVAGTQPAARGLFSAQPGSTPFLSSAVPPPAAPEPAPPSPAPAPVEASDPPISPAAVPVAAPAPSPAKMADVKHSFLGLAPLDTQTDQLLLRALLGTEEKLAAPRVVELLAAQAGLSACVCLHGSHVLSHANKSKPDAVEFQRQAPEIARQLRGLAPLIGIEGAETFTLNAGGRLLTFCFPGETIIGVLHDVEPSNGLRDKITLIARELARMLG